MKVKEKQIEQIRRYCAMGLTYVEIAKLLDIGRRTVQRYVTDNGISEATKVNAPKTPQQKAFDLLDDRYTYSEVAKRLGVTKQTIYNWNRKR
jgi:DNA invertase Pin-like site-specific DNA recombinase